MDDHNKKNPFDDFFGKQSSGNNGEGDRNEREKADDTQKPSYYYSYGPFKSSHTEQEGTPAPEGRTERERRNDHTLVSQGSVEMTPPKAVPVYSPGQPSPAATKNWQVRERKRTSFKALFASFMAGVLVLGGLTVASDRMNWFTSDQALAPQELSASAGNTSVKAAGNNGAEPVSNALDIVRPNNIAKIFEQSSPAVVKIETYVQSRGNGGGTSGGGLFEDPFFRQFFGGDFSAPTPGQGQGGSGGQLVPNGLGSGFLYKKNGYILTNQHVVGEADQIKVTLQGYDKPFEAKLLGNDYNLDLAVLKIEGNNFPTIPLGDSNQINVGEWVVAIGNPNGFDHTVTVGVLSAKERPISIPDAQGTRNYEHLLQTDASINPGNSGGPLINLNGEVVGINTAVSTQSQGIGFAIPTTTIKDVLDTLEANKEIPKTPAPFIGATLSDITEQMASQLGLADTNGAIVYNITYNAPAFKADLRQYDVIVALDGKKYNNKEDLIAAIQKKKVGDKVTLNVIRNGNTIDVQVTIGNRNDFNVGQ
ncbi:peptidase A2 [Paenibacillus darwinianus]|uniref:Peptidase A2 n=1 Tax=Paenibacillus darwinianus TaxID=1380763 RepID=A0A9W5S122_9BACL|nr:trypsin-like peptidase domain-containing protein [Paenibacillus darwinianus]EXX89470.1 peptidase A2 [Paenibacillus darwinianus]EXX91199.1 peptidase A2 [Paenibacillus darwinianus]EXX92507.1 peptidase A2 [Paenibacillus darwinianus]